MMTSASNNPVHRAWLAEQAKRAAAKDGIHSGADWARATREPTPEMAAARDKLSATIAAQRKRLCATDPEARLVYVNSASTDVRATINRERARLGLPVPGPEGKR